MRVVNETEAAPQDGMKEMINRLIAATQQQLQSEPIRRLLTDLREQPPHYAFADAFIAGSQFGCAFAMSGGIMGNEQTELEYLKQVCRDLLAGAHLVPHGDIAIVCKPRLQRLAQLLAETEPLTFCAGGSGTGPYPNCCTKHKHPDSRLSKEWVE